MFTDTFTCFAGELPKELGKLVLNGNQFRGELYVPAYMRLYVLLTFPPCFAGELPPELGNLVNLTDLLLSGNQFQGKLYVPTYMRCVFADISFFL